MSKTTIEIDRILTILPHRWPFVLVDRVTEVIAHELIRGHKCVSMNEPWFLGHYPGRPIMPGVLILEALAQIGGILASAIALVLHFRLMIDIGPTRTLTVTYLIPLFGMLWGVLFLGEILTAPVIAGGALILAGTVLVTRG